MKRLLHVFCPGLESLSLPVVVLEVGVPKYFWLTEGILRRVL